MDSVWLFFALSFPMVAGNGLLDHVPTEAYWKDKHIAISGEAMLAQLQAETNKVDATELIRLLGDPDFATREKATQALIVAGTAVASQIQQAMLSDDPEVATRAKRIAKLLQQSLSESKARQLMAVRTLGELRFTAAEPQLKKLLEDKSTGPVLVRYARRSLAQIKEPDVKLPAPERTLPSPEELLSDLALLPASSNSVLQVAIREPMKMPLNPAIDFKPFFGEGIPADRREPAYMAKLIALVDITGDVRIDAVSAALTGSEEDKKSYVAGVVRGEWDTDALRSLFTAAGFSFELEKGLEIYSYDSQCKIVLISEHRMYVIFGDFLDVVPIKTLLAGGDAPGLLQKNKRLWPLVEKRDITKPVWAAMVPSDLFLGTPWLRPIDYLTLSADQKGSELKLVIEAHAKEQTRIDPALVEFEKMLDKAEPESGQIAAMFPCAKPLEELMVSLKTERKPHGVTATMQTPNFAPLLAVPLVLTHNQWLK